MDEKAKKVYEDIGIWMAKTPKQEDRVQEDLVVDEKELEKIIQDGKEFLEQEGKEATRIIITAFLRNI